MDMEIISCIVWCSFGVLVAFVASAMIIAKAIKDVGPAVVSINDRPTIITTANNIYEHNVPIHNPTPNDSEPSA